MDRGERYKLTKDINDALYNLARSLHMMSPEYGASEIVIKTPPGIVDALWEYHSGNKADENFILRFPGINAIIEVK